MPVNAELRLDFVADLKLLSPPDVSDFYRQLERVRRAPIKSTQPFHDKEISDYLLRRFSFGVGVERIAICAYDGTKIRVLKCRLSQPRRRRAPDDSGGGAQP